MGASHFLSSLSCEVRILEAKNVQLKKPAAGNLFVRYYLSSSSAGNNKRNGSIKLNSRPIPSSSSEYLIWNESFSLECLGTDDSLTRLKQQTVVFELRWRSTVPVLGKIIMNKSLLLGRAEMPWKAVFESPNMEIEKWVTLVSVNDRALQCFKPPSLKISMKVIGSPAMVETVVEEKRRMRKERCLLKNVANWDGCGCCNHDIIIGGGCSCADYELFALTAAFEAL